MNNIQAILMSIRRHEQGVTVGMATRLKKVSSYSSAYTTLMRMKRQGLVDRYGCGGRRGTFRFFITPRGLKKLIDDKLIEP